MVPVGVILSLGAWKTISATGPAWEGVPLVVAACLCFSKSNEKLFCKMMGPPWAFLDGFLWLLLGFPLFFLEFRAFIDAADPALRLVVLAFVFLLFCGAFKGGRPKVSSN